jgi:hypothetical protein
LRASVREDPFKCINNEKPVTGMSADIGPVVTRARGPVEPLLIFPPRPLRARERRVREGDRKKECAVLINTNCRLQLLTQQDFTGAFRLFRVTRWHSDASAFVLSPHIGRRMQSLVELVARQRATNITAGGYYVCPPCSTPIPPWEPLGVRVFIFGHEE